MGLPPQLGMPSTLNVPPEERIPRTRILEVSAVSPVASGLSVFTPGSMSIALCTLVSALRPCRSMPSDVTAVPV